MSASPMAWLFNSREPTMIAIEAGHADEPAAFWRINGYRTRLLVWTQDEWERLETPPSDAQYHPTGVWCALRLD